MADRVVRMGVGLVVGVWIARYLGPARFGSLNFALSYVAILGSLTTLGLDGIIIREIVRDSKNTQNIMGSALVLRLGGSFFALLVSVVSVKLIEPKDHTAMLHVGIVATGLVFRLSIQSTPTSSLRFNFKLTVWAKNAAFLFIAGLRIFLIQIKAPVWTFAVAGVAELALGAIGLIIAYSMVGGNLLKWRTSLRKSADLLIQGWPLILSGMTIMIYMRIDTVMLKVMQGDAAAGLYAAATKISEVRQALIPSAIVTSVSPAIMRSKSNPQLYYINGYALYFPG